jgi:hypothetical protein
MAFPHQSPYEFRAVLRDPAQHAWPSRGQLDGHVSEEQAIDVALIVSELVTNSRWRLAPSSATRADRGCLLARSGEVARAGRSSEVARSLVPGIGQCSRQEHGKSDGNLVASRRAE